MIDFENIGNRWPEALSGAAKGDVAVLFYSDHSPKALLEALEAIERKGVRIKFRKCECGRNGLDFQLSSELGYLIGTCGDTAMKYVVVSGDTGYAVLCGYWSSIGVSVRIDAGTDHPAHGAAGAKACVADCLDVPMTDAGLSRCDRAHVLGCARACMEQLADPDARMERFRADTIRIKGRSTWERLDGALGAVLWKLFRDETG